MSIVSVYDPGATKGQDYRMKKSDKGGFRDKWVDTHGKEREIDDDSGSGVISAVAGVFAPIDVSAFLRDARIVFPQASGILAPDVAYWDPRKAERVLEHGAVTGGPFVIGETITGVDSGATAVVRGVGSDFLQVDTIAGTFEVGERIDGGTSSAFALLTSPLDGAVAGDDPVLDERRFIHLFFTDDAGVALVATTAVDFTFTAKGERLRE